MDSLSISPIDPARYYPASFIATMRGLHLNTVYQSAKGLKQAEIPRVTRFKGEVKFLGQHILDFIVEHSGPVAQASASQPQSSETSASVPTVQAKRGRPRNAHRSVPAGAAA